MLKRKINSLLPILVMLLLISSCVKDVDFDQAENIVLSPVITSSIVFAEVEASRFVVNNSEINEVADTIANIEIFEEQFIKDNLVKAELVFEVSNSIERSFNLNVEFLNDADELQHTLAFSVSGSPNGDSIITNYTEVFEGASLESLKLTTKFAMTLTLNPSQDGSMLDENSTGKVDLKSKGLFYFNVNL